jgi:4-amino-4-deoxy-L-arabinose transferase-like glycosyltransferase
MILLKLARYFYILLNYSLLLKRFIQTFLGFLGLITLLCELADTLKTISLNKKLPKRKKETLLKPLALVEVVVVVVVVVVLAHPTNKNLETLFF